METERGIRPLLMSIISFYIQVRFRFRDESLVQDLEQMGLLLEGMPPVGVPTAASVNPENVSS